MSCYPETLLTSIRQICQIAYYNLFFFQPTFLWTVKQISSTWVVAQLLGLFFDALDCGDLSSYSDAVSEDSCVGSSMAFSSCLSHLICFVVFHKVRESFASEVNFVSGNVVVAAILKQKMKHTFLAAQTVNFARTSLSQFLPPLCTELIFNILPTQIFQIIYSDFSYIFLFSQIFLVNLQDYRHLFVTQYITYLNIWEALPRTLSSLSTIPVSPGLTMRIRSLKALPL